MNVHHGFRVHRVGSRIVVVAAGMEPAIAPLELALPGGVERLLGAARACGGRGRNAVAPLSGRKERLHLRPVLRGGWLARLRVDRLSGPSRPLAELAVNARLIEAGAPVPHPVLVAARRLRPAVWTAAVGTLHRENTCSGLDFLAGRPEPEVLRAASFAAGRAVKRFHDAGGRHADLHLGNLLIETASLSPQVWIVDLDRARVTPRVPARRRMREIMRLQRSALKHGLGSVLDTRIQARFLDGYTAGDRALRRALLAALPRERLRLSIHRLGYRRA